MKVDFQLHWNNLSVLFIEFCRLPIVQGGTFSLLAPTFAILSLENNQCPKYFNKFGWANVLNLTVNGASVTDEYIEKNGWENVDATVENVTNEYKAEQWQYRMQEVCINLDHIFFTFSVFLYPCSKLLSAYNSKTILFITQIESQMRPILLTLFGYSNSILPIAWITKLLLPSG